MFPNSLSAKQLVNLREDLWDQFSYFKGITENSEEYKAIQSFNEPQLKMMRTYLSFLPPELLYPGNGFSLLKSYFSPNYSRMAYLNILKLPMMS